MLFVKRMMKNSLLLSHHKKNVEECDEDFKSSRSVFFCGAAKSERSFVASQKSHPYVVVVTLCVLF
jgi:hypothetical protein